MFGNFNEAFRGLLATTIHALGSDIPYVIAGGWVPVLRGAGNRLQHPGTRDVDVLFVNNLTRVSNAVEVLVQSGFVRSAKHEFQLLRSCHVGGREFEFNVDLMHPLEQTKNGEMFVDHFDLGITDATDPKGRRKDKSIAFASAEVVLELEMWDEVAFTAMDFDGVTRTVQVPLLTSEALILSKAESYQFKKRQRDSFDIYFVLTGPSGAETAKKLLELAKAHKEVEVQLGKLTTWLKDPRNALTFNANVTNFAKTIIPDADKQVLELLKSTDNAQS